MKHSIEFDFNLTYKVVITARNPYPGTRLTVWTKVVSSESEYLESRTEDEVDEKLESWRDEKISITPHIHVCAMGIKGVVWATSFDSSSVDKFAEIDDEDLIMEALEYISRK